MVLRVLVSKMLVFHRFFNGFGGVGIENVDFPFILQWLQGCRDRNFCFSIGFSKVSRVPVSNMSIFHWFFNGFGASGPQNH